LYFNGPFNFGVVVECWSAEAGHRLTFSERVTQIAQQLESLSGYTMLQGTTEEEN